MVWDWVVQLLIAIAVAVVANLIMPKPKGPQAESAKDLEAPVAEAGKPMPRIWGTMTVKGINLLWYGDKNVREFEVKTGGGKK